MARVAVCVQCSSVPAYAEDADCDLPAEVVHHTKRMLIDTLGCAIGGYVSELSTMAWALDATVFSQRPATVLGSRQQGRLENVTRYGAWPGYGAIPTSNCGDAGLTN